MAKYYITVADSMAQSTTTFTALQTLPDGSTLSAIRVPPGMTKISIIGAAVVIDGAGTVDTGNNYTIQLSGTGLADGIQEIVVGGTASQETGTSVTGTMTLQPAFYRPVDIRLKEGDIVISGAFDGTDPGTPYLAVTLGLE